MSLVPSAQGKWGRKRGGGHREFGSFGKTRGFLCTQVNSLMPQNVGFFFSKIVCL